MTSKLETKWDAQGTAPPDEAKTLSLGPIAPQDAKDTLKDRTEDKSVIRIWEIPQTDNVALSVNAYV